MGQLVAVVEAVAVAVVASAAAVAIAAASEAAAVAAAFTSRTPRGVVLDSSPACFTHTHT